MPVTVWIEAQDFEGGGSGQAESAKARPPVGMHAVPQAGPCRAAHTRRDGLPGTAT